MGDEWGSASDIDRPVSSGLSAPIFTLMGGDDFWSSQISGKKCRPRIDKIDFCWIYLGEIESGSQNCLDLHISHALLSYAILCHGQCVLFSSPNMPWLTRLD